MFVQFIEGRVRDEDGLRRQHERWVEELAPGAEGWLGITAGVTPDGIGFIAARFESAEAARRNSDREEQGRWWAETEPSFAGEVSFTDSDEVRTFLGGGSDEAGFVQVIQGRTSDPERAEALFEQMENHLPGSRPDVIGGYIATYGDGGYTQVVYFTSEEEAREGERRDDATDEQAIDDEFSAIHAEGPQFLDLPEPWLVSR